MPRLKGLLEGPVPVMAAAVLMGLGLCAPYAAWVLYESAAVSRAGVTAGMFLQAACFYAMAAHGWACAHGPTRAAGIGLGTVLLTSGLWRLL